MIQPTCEQAGKKYYACANGCDGFITPIPAKGHNFSNGKCTECAEDVQPANTVED